MKAPIIGIDLGTTNSEVAVVRDGKVHMIEVDGQALLPSVVGLADDGTLLVGQTARNQYALRPERTLRSIKRRMGEDVNIALGDQHYTPQEISALILRRLKAAAEAFLGIDVTQAVITVPAYFSDAQRQATREAGALADLDVKRIINEPTAAVLAYEAHHSEAKNVLVYDLGGGTFDVSVVRLAEDINQVLASHGNNRLGGDDFDTRIVKHLVEHLKAVHQVNPSDNPAAMARISRAAEAAKITLSDAPYARIDEEYLLEHNGQPRHLSLELSRDDYEDMIAPLVNDTLEAVHIALEGAKLTVADLDEVLLVGGATRTPLVQRHLEEALGMTPRAELDPDLCVASGAALQGALIAGDNMARVLVDVTPYTFGTSAIDELDGELYSYVYVPLIRKNTPIPVTKSEAFSTVHDGQQVIDVKVFQGEERDALNNTQIGDFRIEGLSDAPAGNIIVTTFTLDINGILEVSAREKSTGLEKRITIENATARFADEALEDARERLSTLIEGEIIDGQAEQRHVVQAKALIEKAERLLENASPEDSEDLVDCMEGVRDALNREDDAALVDAVDELSDLIFYLES
ncbi:Hsp70 family protein [Vreelandella rituensis]|uniref:Heat-shock protein Hsp70 n=1 Tax=Vreelandella rituensis TaxID=2282306 RepID=A0A368TRK6_9GAMM|nr:Hsp70 family protein [Halomonas rituensis]RCV86772.1 heat-shock protein Hsp70 [Halomonas rituensis]